jgi:transcriptional regulator with XRE-family HTH domain
LGYETNWLGNKDYFAIIRKMIKEKRINYACVDALDYTAFSALAQKVKDLKLSVDTIFVSNVFEWISGDYSQYYPVDDPYRDQIRFMASVMSLANKKSYVIYSKPRDAGIFVVEGVTQSPMAWYIGRTGNTLVKVMRNIRTYRKMGAIKARSLLKTYSDVKGLSSKKKIGERITFLREYAGMDIGELAHQVGIRRYILQQYEDGKKTPSFLRVCRIADIFNIDPIVLYTGYPRNKALVRKRMTFGKRLKLLRETNGLSVSELSELSGVSVQSIEDYENHEYQYESSDYILRHPWIVYDLAKALDEEPSVLYKGYPLCEALMQEEMTIGERIQFLLVHLGLSRQELSRRSGVSLKAIQRLEHDYSQGKKVRRDNIDGREAANIYKLAQALNSKEFRVDSSILYEGYPLEKVLARKSMTRGERIKYVRIVRGLSQRELSAMSHISKTTIVQYESGKIGSSPNEQKIKEIADVLNIELSMLNEVYVIPERNIVVEGSLTSA